MNYLEQEVLELRIANEQKIANLIEMQKMFLVVSSTNATLQKENKTTYAYLSENDEKDSVIHGFGTTPEEALKDYYKNWISK